jgi:pimeloyl-ACP methyl ester carboxylesterase
MRLLKFYIRFLDLILPSLAAKKVYHIMSNPRIHKQREFEKEAISGSVKEKIKFKDFDILKYSWGNSANKTALLIHGWEGQSGNFGALIELLLHKGYYIIAYDAPSHGHSSRGNTSMFEYAEFVHEIFKTVRPGIIISHSFGSVTAAFALKENPDIKIDQWFLITTPSHFKDRIHDIAVFIGISHRTVNRLTNRLEKELNISLDKLNMGEYAGNLNNLKEAIIIHSQSDGVIPIEKARKAHEAIPQSELIELEDLGHYRILWSKRLKQILEERIPSLK